MEIKKMQFSDDDKILITSIIQLVEEKSEEGVALEELSNYTLLDYEKIQEIIERLISRGYATLNSRDQLIYLDSEAVEQIRARMVVDESFLYQNLLKKAIESKKNIEIGFLDLAESIQRIHDKKLYRQNYKTFKEFCETEFGLSRQTIYHFFSILNLIKSYPEYFSKEKATAFGHKKMRYITRGVSKIEERIYDENKQEKIKEKIFSEITPEMSSSMIEDTINDIVDK